MPSLTEQQELIMTNDDVIKTAQPRRKKVREMLLLA